MNKRNGKRGFTMAELLIVVAIIGVLAGVSFVAVAQHQRSLERVERDSVAREIFVAAQNHLTMAEGQGFLGLDLADSAVVGSEYEENGSKYNFFAVDPATAYSADAPSTLLDLMLPFGSIDETVRGGGSYIVCYHKESATIKDVFYCSSDSRFGYDLSGTDASTLQSMLTQYGEGKESARRNFNGKVLGWYGGADAATLARKTLEAPLIEVENADRLLVKITPQTSKDYSSITGYSLQLTVKGVDSGAMKTFTLQSTDTSFAVSDPRIDVSASPYTVILDDITQVDMHFADLEADPTSGKPFFPGEDITVQAIAFDNTAISNIAYSAEVTTNSLYESLDQENATAYVSNIRHLENLDKRVSNVTTTKTTGTGANAVTTYTIQNAIQTSDMSWTGFKAATGREDTVVYQYTTDDENIFTDAGCYLPVTPDGYLFSYDGQGHSITGIKVDYAGDAGLFGAISAASTDNITLKNLALIDFDITQKEGAATDGNAGTLAGTLTNVTVTNVVAYDQDSESQVTANSTKPDSDNVSFGNAGGLVGRTADCKIEKSSASVYVTSAAGDAGGLIGTTNNGSVTACYSGGHTDGNGAYDAAKFNVTASAGNAGGLIGSDVSTNVASSYSTCSATGATAGGFAATASADFANCYATGVVKGTDTEAVSAVSVPKDGAFAYSLAGTATNCNYLEIINERPIKDASGNDTDDYECLTALGKGVTSANITAIDADITSYNDFVGDPDTDWKPASAYDASLITYYGGKYPVKTVEQLNDEAPADKKITIAGNDFVTIHHGDWPAPEIFVINATTTTTSSSGD